MLIWTNIALNDLKNILEYISSDDENTAKQIALSFDNACKRIEQFPQIGIEGRKLNTRELFLPKYPFVFIYRQKKIRIEILRILHTHQQWPICRK